jgi:hypothetical protein
VIFFSQRHRQLEVEDKEQRENYGGEARENLRMEKEHLIVKGFPGNALLSFR